ncbi:MAG: HD-GYP domain-containing protein [Thermoleophilia bacterium]|nr:HD-GYP domain-containing protein [Thermoleophilia bacterium]
MTTTAASVSHDETLVRGARERDERGVERHARLVYAAWTPLVLAACVAALALHGGPAFAWWKFALFVALYTGISRVEFEVGIGSAIPTQLVLVPMLFALPIGTVPLAVATALLARTMWSRPLPWRDPARVLPAVSTAAHALGPALVLSLAGGLPLRWSAWPVYVAAVLAQFAFDLAHSLISGMAHRIGPRTILSFIWLVYSVDLALAPVGLAVAFSVRDHAELAVLVLPLVALLRFFSGERQRRLDHALELSDAYRGTAFLLGDVVEADDAYTGSHSRHVVDLVLGVADELKLSEADRRDAEFVALLHDVGKIRIPAEIINKPGKLDAEERAVIETHTIIGEEMLERVGGLLGHVGRLVRSCHEHWDGKGYPDRLAGDAIPLVARIVCACDAFSAMTTDRPYRKGRSEDEALAEMQRCAGTQFDPQVVAALVRVSAAA